MLIYKITNEVNGKVYIGLTTKTLEHRTAEHKNRCVSGERDHKLYLSMRKHGFEKFKFEAVCSARTLEDLKELEKQFIAEYNSFDRGYNMTCGGDTVSASQAAKISATLMGHTFNKGKMPKGASHSMSKSYRVRFPDGEEKTVTGWKAFCREFSLNEGCFHKTLTGQDFTRHHRGFVLLEKLND